MTLLGVFGHFSISLCAGAGMSETLGGGGGGGLCYCLIPWKEPTRVGVSILLCDCLN